MNKKTLTTILVIFALIIIALAFFIPSDFVEEFGVFVYAIPIVLAVILLGLAFTLREKKENKNENKNENSDLILERQQTINAIKQAESDFLKHKISKETFDKFTSENNAKLISIEAKIDIQKNKGAKKEEIKKNVSVSSDKKKVLKGLLEQKQIKVTELKKAEASFYRRKIDETTFKNISSQIKQEIITIDAQIKGIQDSEEIELLKRQLKEGAREISKQKKISKELKKKDYLDEIEEDLLKQISQI